MTPLQDEINQLGRQFWVTTEQIVAQKYDLSASRYRDVEQDGVFCEKAVVTLERLRLLGDVGARQISALAASLSEL